MTFAEIADRYAPKAEDIIGPYSTWPRRKPRRGGRAFASASRLAAVGVMLRSGLPRVFREEGGTP